eukprot:CAMPEP_0172712338 /NCGR_PEP_ID=MMETSP1074-20121228/61037_1 /TAXON_ID=2916 /ORGANISM="Ceratium fusus, Strain PA161109" /LENGTH=65 /DNA_ID=CAMNT_0013536249 /DNA_START=121 /DNA_END=318 /DNA_ORIENTATION=+
MPSGASMVVMILHQLIVPFVAQRFPRAVHLNACFATLSTSCSDMQGILQIRRSPLLAALSNSVAR